MVNPVTMSYYPVFFYSLLDMKQADTKCYSKMVRTPTYSGGSKFGSQPEGQLA